MLQRVSLHGHQIAYRTMGSGPVLLLLHGMAGSSFTWRHVMPALARRFTVVAPDLLGHGDSANPRTEYSLGAHANVVRDLMAALGHVRATLVVQSYGGGLAMQVAYQYPERCERQDVEAGRKTEVEMFAGNVIELGKRCGVATPVNRRLFDELRRIEAASGAKA